MENPLHGLREPRKPKAVLALPSISMDRSRGQLIEYRHITFRTKDVSAVTPLHHSWTREREGIQGDDCCEIHFIGGQSNFVLGNYKEVSQMIFGDV